MWLRKFDVILKNVIKIRGPGQYLLVKMFKIWFRELDCNFEKFKQNLRSRPVPPHKSVQNLFQGIWWFNVSIICPGQYPLEKMFKIWFRELDYNFEKLKSNFQSRPVPLLENIANNLIDYFIYFPVPAKHFAISKSFNVGVFSTMNLSNNYRFTATTLAV